MYKHILIPTDGSDFAQKGVEHGLALAKALGSAVTIVVATDPMPMAGLALGAGWVATPIAMSEYEEMQKKFAEETLAAAQSAAGKAGVMADHLHVPDARAADAILETAEARGCDLIVMASHGRRGVERMLLGSQTAEVLSHSKLPVLVVR